jgi:type IV secretion system protein VirB2
MGKVAFWAVVGGLMAWLVPDLVWAAGAGGGMPWETPLQHLVDSLTGPVAKAIGIVSIFIFGATVALSEGGGLRIVMGIILGLSIMFAAATWGLSFFGFAGGAVM